MEVSKQDIADMRGHPERCDFCGWAGPLAFLEPEEGGDWACWHCQWRWDTNEIADALQSVFGPPTQHRSE